MEDIRNIKIPRMSEGGGVAPHHPHHDCGGKVAETLPSDIKGLVTQAMSRLEEAKRLVGKTIVDVKQTQKSSISSGLNVIQFVANDGSVIDFEVRNGEQGLPGKDANIAGANDAANRALEAANVAVNMADAVADINRSMNEAEAARAAAEAARVVAEQNRKYDFDDREEDFDEMVSSLNGMFWKARQMLSVEEARVSAESARASAETERVSAETNRSSAESARVDAETSRNSAEAGRVTSEAGRVSAEAARVAAETARENASAAAVSAAEAATESANSAAESASQVSDQIDALALKVSEQKEYVEGLIVDDTLHDFSIEDESGTTIVSFDNGHIKTDNFDSQNVSTRLGSAEGSISSLQSSVGSLEETIENLDIDNLKEEVESQKEFSEELIVDDIFHDFSIEDDGGNTIVSFDNGHLKTTSFDSKDITERVEELEENSSQNNGDASVDDDPMYDFSICDENGNVGAVFSSGHIETAHFNSRKVNSTLDELTEKPKIYCIGDSITAGQAGKMTNPTLDDNIEARYPIFLQEMVGSGYDVWNLGAGGERIGEIWARMGWCTANVVSSFTLPKNGSEVLLTSKSSPNIVDSTNGVRIATLFQGMPYAAAQKKFVTINGVKCNLRHANTVTDETGQTGENTTYISLAETRENDLIVKSGAQLIFNGATYSDNAIYLIYAGQNDGSSGLTDQKVLDYFRTMAHSVKNHKFLIMGYFTSIPNEKTARFNDWNAILKKEFGTRFIDAESYICSKQSFEDIGYTPSSTPATPSTTNGLFTYNDLYAIENGILPISFWGQSNTTNHPNYDNIHLDGMGYKLMAKMFYDRLKTLNWI